MKNLILTCLIVSVFSLDNCFAWEWESYGPEGIKANKLCFFEWNSINAVACVDTGMYILSGYGGISYEYYSYANMEVVEAVSAGFGFESDSILLIMSDGSWSDGIYSFPGESGEFTLLHYCYDPHFILKSMDTYFVGYDNGLLISEDGITWNDIPFFSGMACIDMATNYEDFIVATNGDLNNTFRSTGDLNTWNQLTSVHISELCNCNYFSNNYFYGINNGDLVNCGFYRLIFQQTNWVNVFYSYNLNTVGISSDGNPLVGWYEGNAPHTGIAQCVPEFTYLNDGLPNLNIHAINAPIIWGSTKVYCCTDNGMYRRTLSVGEAENKFDVDISVYPNPSSGQVNILVNLPDFITTNDEILIFDNSGIKVDEIKVENTSSQSLEITWNKGNLPSGVYYLVVRSKNETLTEKFIIL